MHLTVFAQRECQLALPFRGRPSGHSTIGVAWVATGKVGELGSGHVLCETFEVTPVAQASVHSSNA